MRHYFLKDNFLVGKMQGNKKCYFQFKENTSSLARRKEGMSYKWEQEMLLLQINSIA